jgi:hypothetical protein
MMAHARPAQRKGTPCGVAPFDALRFEIKIRFPAISFVIPAQAGIQFRALFA